MQQEERLLRVEMRVDYHARQIEEMRTLHSELKKEFYALEETLRSIKNWLIGAIAFAAIEQMGLFEFLKKVFL